ncbi:Uncharacterised protein [Bacillus subtilis]|nr:Uncharacterised protein [Bacillus subtilis]
MHAPLSLLKQMLKEHQIDTEKAVTFEEYIAMRLKLQELMGKFASIGGVGSVSKSGRFDDAHRHPMDEINR